MGAARPSANLSALLLISVAAAFQAGSSVITVEPDTPAEGRWTISSAAYRMVINLASPRIDSFEAGDYALIEDDAGLAPTINTGAPWGPAQAAVAMTGPAVTHVVLYGMRWEKELTGDIEMHFFCYPNRVIARMDIIPRATPPTLLLGWVGKVAQAAPFPEGDALPDWRPTLGANEALAPAALLLPPLLKGKDGRRGAHVRFGPEDLVNAHYVFNSHDIGVRSLACTLLAAVDKPSVLALLEHENAQRRMQFEVENGRYLKYDDTTGMLRFIIKPGVDAMSISMVGAVGSEGYPLIAAVSDRRYRDARIETEQSSPTDVLWLPKSFDPVGAAGKDGPGAYVFPLEASSKAQTLRLQQLDENRTGDSSPTASAP